MPYCWTLTSRVYSPMGPYNEIRNIKIKQPQNESYESTIWLNIFKFILHFYQNRGYVKWCWIHVAEANGEALYLISFTSPNAGALEIHLRNERIDFFYSYFHSNLVSNTEKGDPALFYFIKWPVLNKTCIPPVMRVALLNLGECPRIAVFWEEGTLAPFVDCKTGHATA